MIQVGRPETTDDTGMCEVVKRLSNCEIGTAYQAYMMG